MGKELAERFWSKVNKAAPDECWIWAGKCNSKGYGALTVDGKRTGAHRISLSIHLGREIRPGLWALHSCDNPPCVNPAHLREGTAADNMKDAMDRGRHRAPPWNGKRIGEGNPRAKLSWATVRQIRSDRRTQMVMAAHYGIAQSVISEIVNRKAWIDDL